ncbi:MAG: PDZ domain-containing protein [Planctomycetes bacterium]|nr:PDZ domain-containing protein [Planctomycetota bacterium]
MRGTRLVGIILVLALATAVAPAIGQDAAPPVVTPLHLERSISRAFERAEYRRAADLIESWLEKSGDDPQMLYNLACARSRLGDPQKACSALYRAVQVGFRDFAHMQRDPDLAAIRDEEMYRAIVEAARQVAGDEAEDALARWKGMFGDKGYRYEVDHERRIAYATALDEVSHGEMRRMLEREADHLTRTLFETPPEYYVLVAIPKPADAARMFDDESTRGQYQHARRMLVSRDIGGSLRHEFVHALHYGHMERLGLTKPHPIWIQEGLAALYEDYELTADGEITFLPNERENVARRLARIGRLRDWSELFAMTPDRFMLRPGQYYPQVRAIFQYLAERGKLTAWYRAYLRHFADDPTGTRAFEIVFERDLAETFDAWRVWLRQRPAVDTRVELGDASLGIESNYSGSNDGVAIQRVLPRSAAAYARLKRGDVIVSIDGTPTRSLTELQTIIGKRQVGDRVTVRVRRRTEYLERTVVLRPLRPVR